jgi:exosortase E/protease (VPEID-CTERM system)
LWTGSGAAVLVSLIGCVVPVRRATSFVAEQRWVILLGLCAGTLAFALAKYVTTYWPLSGPMGFATLWVSDQFLDAFVGAHIYHPDRLVLGLDSFSVHVTRACSGYEGVGLFSVFYSLFLCIYRERLCFPRALLLLPLGIAAVWTLNSLRIALLVIIGARWSPELAVEGFHVHAGWPALIAVALVAVALSTRFRAFGARIVPGEQDVETVNPTAAYLGPLLASLGSLMIAGAVIEEYVAVAPVRVGCTLLALWFLRHHYAELRTRPAWSGVVLGALAAVVWTSGRLWYPGPTTSGATLDWRTEIAPSWLWIWWPIAVFSHVVVAPLAEELAFRGFLLRRLAAVEFETFDPRRVPIWTVVVSSVLFGVVHQHWIVATCAGLLYALAYRRRGRLIDAIVAHGVTNLLVLAFAASTGRWELWTSQ